MTDQDALRTAVEYNGHTAVCGSDYAYLSPCHECLDLAALLTRERRVARVKALEWAQSHASEAACWFPNGEVVSVKLIESELARALPADGPVHRRDCAAPGEVHSPTS